MKLVRFPVDLEDKRLGEIEERELQKLFTQNKEARSAIREAEVGEKLDSHPNLADVHCFGYVGIEKTVQLCLLSKYIEGEELGEFLKEERSEKEISKILLQICEGLKSIHSRGIVHRDLSSRNIMVEKDGNVRIIDFGIAFFLDTIASTFSLTLKDERFTDPKKSRGRGNPSYMAPEVWEPHNHLKLNRKTRMYNPIYQSDIWALGVIAFELWCGGLPFNTTNDDLEILRHKICQGEIEWPKGAEISGILQILITLCLSKSPSNRPTLEEIIDCLDGIQEEKVYEAVFKGKYQKVKEVLESIRKVRTERGLTPLPPLTFQKELTPRQIKELAEDCVAYLMVEEAITSLFEIDMNPDSIPSSQYVSTYFRNIITHLIVKRKLREWLEVLDKNEFVFPKKWLDKIPSP